MIIIMKIHLFLSSISYSSIMEFTSHPCSPHSHNDWTGVVGGLRVTYTANKLASMCPGQ